MGDLTPEEIAIITDVIWSAMTCSYKNAIEHPGKGLKNFYKPESFLYEINLKLSQLAKASKGIDREKLARIICCFAKENVSCGECQYNILGHSFPDCFPDIREDTDKIILASKGIDREKIAECIYYHPVVNGDKGFPSMNECRDLTDQIIALLGANEQ